MGHFPTPEKSGNMTSVWSEIIEASPPLQKQILVSERERANERERGTAAEDALVVDHMHEDG